MKIYNGNNLEILKTFADNSIDSVVTDPPYGLSFMGKAWDYDVPKSETWREVLRVLKPGGHLLSFFGTRTYHRGVVAIEDAGFEIRDQIGWAYGSGFPKSHNIAKAITATETTGGSSPQNLRKARMGKDYQVTGQKDYRAGRAFGDAGNDDRRETTLTESAKQWQGWGTALKPAWEPICVARKPLEGTVAGNVLKHGTGAINIDGCRVATKDTYHYDRKGGNMGTVAWKGLNCEVPADSHPLGRWPANLIHDGSEEVLAQFPESKSGAMAAGTKRAAQDGPGSVCYGTYGGNTTSKDIPASSGSAARFFYCAKTSKADRNEGLDCYLTVKYDIPNNGGISCEEITVAVQLLKKAISDTEAVSFSTGECGVNIMARCHRDSLSITLTETNKIIESQILNSSTPSPTNASTPAAKKETESGGNLAVNAENLNAWLLTITHGNQELARGAKDVALKMLYAISEKENWTPANNFHATVKPTDLMRYLCRLVTPPGGTVLDPFMGSGSTGKAAILEGFDFIGIELDAEYCKIANARIEFAKGNK